MESTMLGVGKCMGKCSICLDLLNLNEEISVLHCGHLYHAPCITRWREKGKDVCPTCRIDVDVEKKISRIFPVIPDEEEEQQSVINEQRENIENLKDENQSLKCKLRAERHEKEKFEAEAWKKYISVVELKTEVRVKKCVIRKLEDQARNDNKEAKEIISSFRKELNFSQEKCKIIIHSTRMAIVRLERLISDPGLGESYHENVVCKPGISGLSITTSEVEKSKAQMDVLELRNLVQCISLVSNLGGDHDQSKKSREIQDLKSLVMRNSAPALDEGNGESNPNKEDPLRSILTSLENEEAVEDEEEVEFGPERMRQEIDDLISKFERLIQ